MLRSIVFKNLYDEYIVVETTDMIRYTLYVYMNDTPYKNSYIMEYIINNKKPELNNYDLMSDQKRFYCDQKIKNSNIIHIHYNKNPEVVYYYNNIIVKENRLAKLSKLI